MSKRSIISDIETSIARFSDEVHVSLNAAKDVDESTKNLVEEIAKQVFYTLNDIKDALNSGL